MRRLRLVSVTAVMLLGAASCGGDVSERDRGVAAPQDAGTDGGIGAFEPFPSDVGAADFDPGLFDRSTVIDNEWLPLVPGTHSVFRGRAIGDEGPVHRRIELTVTDLRKVVAGVPTLVIWIEDFDDDRLVEAELAFRAQDRDGNVWHLGEFPQEYENGRPAAAPAWIAGVAGARAGITMTGEPRAGAAPYAQGFAPPPVGWMDYARVQETGVSTCVPVSCYDDVLVTEEFEPDSPGAFQLKYYAPGVGNVRVGWRGLMEEERETLVLTKQETLGPRAMAEVRADALALESRAYRVSKGVYGTTPPADRMAGV